MKRTTLLLLLVLCLTPQPWYLLHCLPPHVVPDAWLRDLDDLRTNALTGLLASSAHAAFRSSIQFGNRKSRYIGCFSELGSLHKSILSCTSI